MTVRGIFRSAVTVSALLACAGCQGSADRDYPHGCTHRHRTEREWREYQARLESPKRATWQKRERVIAALKLRPGERVADIGAGTGYFTIPIAGAVGPTGRVYAVDVARQMIAYVTQRAHREGLEQVIPILATPDNPTLPDAGVDTILIVNTYHHLQDREAYLQLLDEALAPGGRIVNIDYRPTDEPDPLGGPPQAMRVPHEQVDAEMAEAGFFPAAIHDFLPRQYFIEYRRR